MSLKGSSSPPSFGPTNTINISSTNESTITKISLYSGRAEITRSYRLVVKTGQNQVKIDELPNAVDQNSLRVEGRGAATIQGVAFARTPTWPTIVPSTSEALKDLTKQKALAEKALARCRQAVKSIHEYLSTVTTHRIEPDKLGSALRSCEVEGELIDTRIVELEEKIKSLDDNIQLERLCLLGSTPQTNEKLQMTANIGLFAAKEGDAELTLTYAVKYASWKAGYDIRVNTQANEKPVALVYKAIISQTTGEDWKDVPLTLETVAPTYGTQVPVLLPLKLSVYRPRPPPSLQATSIRYDTAPVQKPRMAPTFQYELAAAPPPPPLPEMDIAQASVASQTTLNTTFQVPGVISVPSDGESHSVTIAELALEAKLSWITVPKLDSRVHLKARIKNASDYTLLPGDSSVYVDGSFIAKTGMPSVSPEESFDCSLGIDSALRVTYHPLSKNTSQSGLLSKTHKRVYIQRISVFNAKTKPVDNLKILERFPVSEDAQITVKLVSPSLSTPSAVLTGSLSLKGGKDATEGKPLLAPVKVSDGVVAQWDGGDDPAGDITSLGKAGLFNWLCTVPPQGTVNLTLQWEVQYPLDVTVSGL